MEYDLNDIDANRDIRNGSILVMSLSAVFVIMSICKNFEIFWSILRDNKVLGNRSGLVWIARRIAKWDLVPSIAPIQRHS